MMSPTRYLINSVGWRVLAWCAIIGAGAGLHAVVFHNHPYILAALVVMWVFVSQCDAAVRGAVVGSDYATARFKAAMEEHGDEIIMSAILRAAETAEKDAAKADPERGARTVH